MNAFGQGCGVCKCDKLVDCSCGDAYGRGCYERHEADGLAEWQAGSRSGGGRTTVCKCGKCTDCTQRAAVKKRKLKERQAKNTKARQEKRTSNKKAGDDGEQAKNTKARQEKRVVNKKAG